MTPKTLLLVEDSFTIQKLVESTFTSAGYQVVIANDAREGLGKLSVVAPDIVLADASMPEMDGFQLCQTIRSTQGFERIPVLLLTSRFAAYDEIQGQRSGVTGYLAKPFDSYSLLTLVQQLVDKAPTPALDAPPLEDRTASADLALGDDAPPAPQPYHDLTVTLSHIVQETVQSYLVTLLDALTPQIVADVQATVDAKMPELLEALLQREIDKLKQEATQDDAHGDRMVP